MSEKNTFNKKKLLLSKWTAVEPQGKEKHFMISELLEDEKGEICACILEAVLTTQEYQIDPQELEDVSRWHMGWK
ncbi:TIGR02450 family Trp-rich protein [Marinicella sp. W31]|uniref:TIGR02450 family Trp-rich protein n=1 Tax=Marinicella sp. W31 TaxID=3023713 RepID=UPI0037574D96